MEVEEPLGNSAVKTVKLNRSQRLSQQKLLILLKYFVCVYVCGLVMEYCSSLCCSSLVGSVMAHHQSPHHVVYLRMYVMHLCRFFGHQPCSFTSWRMLLLHQSSCQVWWSFYTWYDYGYPDYWKW